MQPTPTSKPGIMQTAITVLLTILTTLGTGTFIFLWNLNARFAVVESTNADRARDITELKQQVQRLSIDVSELKGQVGVLQQQKDENEKNK